MFVYQPTFSTLDLKEHKGTEYIIAWKSKKLFKFRLDQLYNAFMPYIKRFGYRIGIRFNNSTLVAEEKLVNQNCKWLHCLWIILLAKESA